MINQSRKKRGLNPLLLFVPVLLLIFTPLFKRGFFFSYDGLFFYPKIVTKLDYLLPNIAPTLKALDFISGFISPMVMQRAIWILFLLIGAVGCYFLFNSVWKGTGYFAGIFFICNPFVYERLSFGQILIIAGTSFYPWVFYFLYRYYTKARLVYVLGASLSAGLAVSYFTHSMIILNILVLCFFVFISVKRKNAVLLAFFILYLMIIILTNYYWLGSSLFRGTSLAGLAKDFNKGDFELYRTSTGRENKLFFNLATLNGFWAEKNEAFNYHLDSALSIVSSLFIFLVIGIGFWARNRFQVKYLSLVVLTLGALSMFLAAGYANKHTGYLTSFIVNTFPPYRGLRETQKWVVVLMFVEMYFYCLGVKYLLEKLGKPSLVHHGLLFFLLLLPAINTWQIFWGFNGQLEVADYPASWYEVNRYLNSKQAGRDAVFLPWHFYLELSFTGKETINPAIGFFDTLTYIGSDIEAGNTYYQFYKNEVSVLEKQVELMDSGKCPNLDTLKDLGVGYLIMAKEKDWNRYIFIQNCEGIRLELEYPEICLLGLN